MMTDGGTKKFAIKSLGQKNLTEICLKSAYGAESDLSFLSAVYEQFRFQIRTFHQLQGGMMLRISVVVGNPKPNSRTLKVAETLVGKMFSDAQASIEVFDLADYRDEILKWPSEKMDALNSRVAESDLAVFASPTYKATYTGLLKLFLDRYPAQGLSGVVAIPLMTGADHAHSMGTSVNLSPLLVELGAVVPGRGFYFVIGNMDKLEEIATSAAADYRHALRRLKNISEHLAKNESEHLAKNEKEKK